MQPKSDTIDWKTYSLLLNWLQCLLVYLQPLLACPLHQSDSLPFWLPAWDLPPFPSLAHSLYSRFNLLESISSRLQSTFRRKLRVKFTLVHFSAEWRCEFFKFLKPLRKNSQLSRSKLIKTSFQMINCYQVNKTHCPIQLFLFLIYNKVFPVKSEDSSWSCHRVILSWRLFVVRAPECGVVSFN